MGAHDDQVTLAFLCDLKNACGGIAFFQTVVDLELGVSRLNLQQLLLSRFALSDRSWWWRSHHHTALDDDRSLQDVQNQQSSSMLLRHGTSNFKGMIAARGKISSKENRL